MRINLTTSLFILVLFISSCASIDTTVKIEPGFVGQKYTNICVLANYEVTATESTPEKYFCDELKRRGIKATAGKEILNYPEDYMDDSKIIAVLKKNKFEACLVITLEKYHVDTANTGKLTFYLEDSTLHFSEYTPPEIVTDKPTTNIHYAEYLITVIDLKTNISGWSALSKIEWKEEWFRAKKDGTKIIAKDICKRLQRDNVIGR